MSRLAHHGLADLVLLLHLGVVLFVVGGLLAIVIGRWRGWAWVRGRAFRYSHLATIGFVVLQTWLGRQCPLTRLESWLRVQAGAVAHERGFIEHGVARLLYWDAPSWVFTSAYSAFGALVLIAWRLAPPHRHGAG